MGDKKETIYAFIDSQNLNLSVLNDLVNDKGKIYYEGWKLDFRRFFVYLRDKYRVKIAFLFIGRVEGYEKLYKFLEGVGYYVVYKPTLEYKAGGNRYTKGNVDAELVLHAMIEYPNYDKAVIVAGDGDFHCLVEYLEQKGKLAKLLIPNKLSYSSLLRRFNSYIAYVTDLKAKLEYKKGN